MASDPTARRRPRAAAVLLAVAALAISFEALAGPPSPAEKETARTLMDQGDDRMEARDYAGALKAYQSADAIMHLPMTTVAVARAEEAAGLLLEARDAALLAVRVPAQPGEGPAYARARAEAQSIADRLVARIPAVQIALQERPAGLTVTIDGAEVPAAALDAPRKVNPGKHVVEARAPGQPAARAEVVVAEGATLSVRLSFAPGSGPLGPTAPTTPSRRLSPLVYVGFGVGGAGLVAGAITGGLSWSKTSQLATLCGTAKKCPPGTLATPTLLANVSDAGFAVGAAGVVAGVVGILLSRGGAPPAAAGVAVRPVIGPGYLGVAGAL